MVPLNSSASDSTSGDGRGGALIEVSRLTPISDSLLVQDALRCRLVEDPMRIMARRRSPAIQAPSDYVRRIARLFIEVAAPLPYKRLGAQEPGTGLQGGGQPEEGGAGFRGGAKDRSGVRAGEEEPMVDPIRSTRLARFVWGSKRVAPGSPRDRRFELKTRFESYVLAHVIGMFELGDRRVDGQRAVRTQRRPYPSSRGDPSDRTDVTKPPAPNSQRTTFLPTP